MKITYCYLSLFFAIGVLLGVSFPGAAFAERNSFYGKAFTDGFFNETVYRASDSGKFNIIHRPLIDIIREQREKALKEKEKELREGMLPASLTPPDEDEEFTEVGEEEDATEEELSPRQEIIQRNGDPSERQPLRVQEDAPPPFRGMVEALDVGDDKLAYAYAKQWMRYMNRYREMLDQVNGWVAAAGENTGYFDEDDIDPKYDPYREFAETVEGDEDLIEEDETLTTAEVRERVLEEQTQRFFEKAKIYHEASASERLEDDSYNEVIERAKARKLLKNMKPKIKRETEGVLVYFFFRPKDKESVKMLPVAEELYQMSLEDERIKFQAFTFEHTVAGELDMLRYRTNTTFPIEYGGLLVNSFKLTEVPTTVVVGLTTKQSYFEEGARSFYYLDEFLKAMLGRKKSE